MTALSTAGGVACALAAGVLFEVGYVEQAAGARELRDARLSSLLRRPAWRRGTGMVVAGLILQLAALAIAPIGVVQPVLVLGLGALVVLAERRLGEPVTLVQRLAVAAAALAVVAVVAGGPRASPHPGVVHDRIAAALVAAAVLAALAVGRRDPRGWVAAAAVGEAGAVLGAKLAFGALPDLLPAAGWGVSAAAVGVVALQSEMAALRRLPAAVVGPLVLLGQVALPVALAPLVVGERWGRPALVVAGLLLAAAACAVLGAAREK